MEYNYSANEAQEHVKPQLPTSEEARLSVYVGRTREPHSGITAPPAWAKGWFSSPSTEGPNSHGWTELILNKSVTPITLASAREERK